MTKIKLCGLSLPESITTVNTLQPDYVGFVFAKKSKRYITPKEAASLKEHLNANIQAVGVMVNMDIEKVLSLVRENIIDIIQLHGKEDEKYIRELKNNTDATVIKAFGIVDKEDIKRANECGADYVLLDSPGGGTGKSFDHSLLKYMEREYFLSGGLTPETVGDYVKKYKPYAVDVSSGIETNGIKDADKMRAFVENVKG